MFQKTDQLTTGTTFAQDQMATIGIGVTQLIQMSDGIIVTQNAKL